MSNTRFIRGKDGKFAGSTAGATAPKTAPKAPKTPTTPAAASDTAKPVFFGGNWQTSPSGVPFRHSHDATLGTHLVGEKVATRADLEAVLGPPTFLATHEDEYWDKVLCEWSLEVVDNNGDTHAVTIYDWKRYDDGPPAADESYEWHIGGHNDNAVAAVERLLAGKR